MCLLLAVAVYSIVSQAGAEEGPQGELDELIIESPTHIDDLAMKAVKEYSRQIREQEGGMGAVCSKDEHCTDETQKGQHAGWVCGRNGRCKPNNTDVDDACRWGLHTCMHKEGSAMRAFAEEEVRNRLGKLDKDEDTMGNKLQTALLPAPAQMMMALPPPPSMNNESTEDEVNQVAELQQSAEGGQLTPAREAFVNSLALVDDVSQGALAASGALPSDTKEWLPLAKVGKERVTRRPFYNYWDKEDRSWRVATATAEHEQLVNASKYEKARAFPNTKDMELMEWFKKGGGILSFAEPSGDPKKARGAAYRTLLATEEISENDLLLEVPLKLTLNQLTVRNIPTNEGHYLGHYLGGMFGRNQEWGLASLLLYELSKGNSSRWWPFIRTLDMHVLSKRTLRELRGTFLAEKLREWEFEAEVMMKNINKVVEEKDHMGRIKKWSTRKEMRWALWVVRRHSIWVTKVTTGKKIRALVPFANYLRHRRGAGGHISVGLDNKIRVNVGSGGESTDNRGFSVGQELLIDHGPYSDTETMLRYHEVDDTLSDADRNPNNRISVKLPGTKDMNAEDIFWEWTSTKEWRRFMKYPPKQSDLWRLANKLQLYGEEWDEEEQKAISQANQQVIGALPFSIEQVPAEEQLMLLGHASTEEEAQLIVYGHVRDSNRVAQLYTAPDPEEDERAAKAMEEMADAMVQLQEAVAAGHTDPSVLEVINETKAFFLHGVQPKRGLDALDKYMMRKRTMMDECGNATEHWISFCDRSDLGGVKTSDKNGQHCVSPHLLCALRVHTMNETEMDIVCPMQKGAFWTSDPEDRKCEGGGFNWTLAVSQENENATIQALRGTLTALLEDYSSSEEQDAPIIDAYRSTVGSLDEGHLMSLIRFNSVLVRQREKVLLRETISWLDDRLANLGNVTYQIEEVRRKEEARKQRIKERKAWRKRIKEELSKPVPVSSIVINLGKEAGGEVNFTWYEGQSIEDAALEFGVKHGLTYSGLDQLKAAARPRVPKQKRIVFFMPVVLADGIRAAIRVNEGENATLIADKFCARHEVEEVSNGN